jgi:hypothetical protein
MKSTLRFFLLLTALSSFILTACETTTDTTTGDDSRDPYVGVWQFAESGKSIHGNSYIVTITKDAGNSEQVILENFGNPGTSSVSVTGLVTTNQIVVTSQNMGNGWTVEGSGKITDANKTKMTWTYSITAGGDKTTYTAYATKL